MVSKLRNAALLLVGGLVAFWAVTTLVDVAQGGDMDPPGAPGSTMLPLDDVEARTPIHQSDMPYTISQSGSYYLAEDLTGTSGQNGITISADNVDLDLNGFALIGVPGSLDGVSVPAAQFNISLYNGTVRDWGGQGVEAASFGLNSRFQDLRLYNNGAYGLRTGGGSTVVRCSAYDNGADGIYATEGNLVTESTAYSNGGSGIEAKAGSTVSNCAATGNGSDGIRVYGGIVSNCTAEGNGDDGISASDETLIIGNRADNNAAAGIATSAFDNRIEGNIVTGNDIGIDVDSGGNLVVKNGASNNTTADYSIVAGNMVGPIAVGPQDPITETNPWANFSY